MIDKPKKNHIVYLDFLKIMAALMVTFYHLSFYKLDYGIINSSSSGFYMYLPNLERIFMSLCCASVPLFFMCSGAQLLQKDRDYRYCFKKALKLLFLTAIWWISDFPHWFFFTMTGLYILLPILQYFIRKKPKSFNAILLLLLIFPFLYNYFLPLIKFFTGRTFSRTGVFTIYSIMYFALGYYIVNSDFKLVLGVIVTVIGIFLSVFEVVFNVCVFGVMFDGVNASFPSLSALILSSGIFILVKNINFKMVIGNILSFLSQYVLSIYLMHVIFIRISVLILKYSELNLIEAIIGTILIDSICILIGLVVSKIPYLRELVKI